MTSPRHSRRGLCLHNQNSYMDRNLMSDLGENYEYIKVLVENRIELVKLDIAEIATKLIGKALLLICLLSVGLLILLGLLVSLAIWLGIILNSFALGVLIVCLILLIMGAIAYAFRKPLFYIPATHVMLSIIDNEEEKE